MRPILALSLVLLAACGKGSGSPSTTSASPVIGTWSIPSTTRPLVQFKSDGTVVETNWKSASCTISVSGTYSIAGNGIAVSITSGPTYSDQAACDADCVFSTGLSCDQSKKAVTLIYGESLIAYEIGNTGLLKLSTSDAANIYLERLN